LPPVEAASKLAGKRKEATMEERSRPEAMGDLEWLVALEEIRQLKARRDRYVDAHDWDGYEALHAPDHVSRHAPDPSTGMTGEPWTSAAEMMRNMRAMLVGTHTITAHHSYDPEIVFDTRTKARGIWAMQAAGVFKDADGEPGWQISHGYYYETYEKRDGRWLFTERRWHRHFGTGSEGVIFPTEPARGSDAFSR
jgi:hypothetical protein